MKKRIRKENTYNHTYHYLITFITSTSLNRVYFELSAQSALGRDCGTHQTNAFNSTPRIAHCISQNYFRFLITCLSLCISLILIHSIHCIHHVISLLLILPKHLNPIPILLFFLPLLCIHNICIHPAHFHSTQCMHTIPTLSLLHFCRSLPRSLSLLHFSSFLLQYINFLLYSTLPLISLLYSHAARLSSLPAFLFSLSLEVIRLR